MDITKQHWGQQEAKQLQSRISSFIGDYQESEKNRGGLW